MAHRNRRAWYSEWKMLQQAQCLLQHFYFFPRVRELPLWFFYICNDFRHFKKRTNTYFSIAHHSLKGNLNNFNIQIRKQWADFGWQEGFISCWHSNSQNVSFWSAYRKWSFHYKLILNVQCSWARNFSRWDNFRSLNLFIKSINSIEGFDITTSFLNVIIIFVIKFGCKIT